MTYRLPQTDNWSQPNVGSVQGTLWATFNTDLTRKKGSIFGTRLITTQSTSSDLANLGLPVGFVKHDTGVGTASAPWFTVAGARVFKTSAGSQPSAFTQDAGSSTPTTCSSACSDLATYNSELYVTTASNTVYYKSTGSWSSFTAGSSDTNAHLLCVYGNRMYMTTGVSSIISWNASRTVATVGSSNTIRLASAGLGGSVENAITFIKPVSNGIWIGTINQLGGNGRVYFWNGTTTDTYQNVYTLESTGAVSCVIKDDTPWIMDNNGRLLVYNGGTFVEKARLPAKNKKLFTNALVSSNERWIHSNGMAVIDNRINILVALSEYSNNTQNEENCPSGIWEYEPEIGLYHKYSVSYYDTAVASVTDFGQARIGHSPGLGTSSGAGGLARIFNDSDSANRNGTLLAGFKYYTDATTVKYGVFYDDNNFTIQTYSHIITSRLSAIGARDIWNSLVVGHKQFLTATDKIQVKYRDTDVEPTEGTITWVSTNGFTTTLNLSAYSIGHEVEILQGIGAGKTSHITAIQSSDSGYIVSVDETYTGATGTSIARFQKWKKAGEITYTNQLNDDTGNTFIDMKENSDIQLKICVLSTGKNELKFLYLFSA